MAAEVCLLLMQSLTGECNADLPNMASPIPQVQESNSLEDVASTATSVQTNAPTPAKTEPQFGNVCEGNHAQRLVVCVIPSKAQENWTAPRSMAAPRATPNEAAASLSQPSTPPVAQPTTSASPNTDLTAPIALDIPLSFRSAPQPTLPSPQFSHPRTVATAPSVPVTYSRQRPTTGTQLFRLRQLALQSGRAYTRLLPSTYVEQWSQATRQPTYQDWKNLLVQEARAVAGGQGQNRLEVVLGDSFGLWIPPEMLPRDRLWLNQSISGDTTAGIMQRVAAFAGTRPTTIHLLAGANDLKNGVPETQIVRNMQQTVRLLRQQHPQAKIVIYSVLPTRRAEIGNEQVRSLNARLALLSQQSQVEYRDINQWFQDEWGHLRQDLTTDGLHLNPQGYALWQQALLARAQ